MFIDDLYTINNDEFEKNYNLIYPDELELKNENKDLCKASFLDLTIDVHDRKFTSNLFDKRYAFPFYISRMPNLDSNMPSKVFYTLIGSEILRIVRTTIDLIKNVLLI